MAIAKAQWKTFEGLRIKKIKTNKIKLRMMVSFMIVTSEFIPVFAD